MFYHSFLFFLLFPPFPVLFSSPSSNSSKFLNLNKKITPPGRGGGWKWNIYPCFKIFWRKRCNLSERCCVNMSFFSNLVDFGIIVSEWSYNFGENNCLLTLNYKTKLWPILFWTIYRLFLSLDSFIKTSFTLVKYKIWIRIFSN